MADAGTISVRLTALTADFNKSLKKAADSVAQLEKGMKLGQLKQAFGMVERAVRAIADVAPEVRSSLDELGASWDDLLRKFGPGTKAAIDGLKAPLGWLAKMADKLAFAAGAVGAYSGGMSYQDFKSSWDQDQRTLDFGGAAAAPEAAASTAGMLSESLAAKKDKWADYLTDFVWGGMEDAMAALGESGVGGFDFKDTDTPDWADISDEVKLGGRDAATQSLVDSVQQKNLATTSSMIKSREMAGAIGGAVASNAGAAGSIAMGFAQGGPAGAGAALAGLAMQTERVQDALKPLNETIMTTVEIFVELQGPLLDLLKVVAEIANLGLGKVKSAVKGLWGDVKGLFGFGESDPGGQGFLGDIMDNLKKLGEEAAKTSKKFSDLNIPHGVKVALQRYNAIDTGPSGRIAAMQSLPGMRDGPVTVNQMIVNANDPYGLMTAMKKSIARAQYAQTGTIKSDPLGGYSDGGSATITPLDQGGQLAG